jgi:hypothetical protein
MCGASSSEKNIGNEQTQNFQTLQNEAGQVFGQSSQIFNQLNSAFSPILAAGPGQPGYTPAELSNLQSQAVTQGGIATRNAEQAAGERSAAQGGGTAVLPSGATLGMNANIAEAGAANTANSLAQINLNNAALGRQNWTQAAGVLAGAPSVYGEANSFNSGATGSGQAAFGSANTINQQNQAWQGQLMGILGDATQLGAGALKGGFGSGGGNNSGESTGNTYAGIPGQFGG